jgi:cytochrome c556
MKLFLVLIFTAFAAFAALPQDEKAFEAAMKEVLPASGSLRGNVGSKNADGAKADAAKLEKIFKTSEDFWTARKTQDAIDWSKQAKEAAAAIGKLAAAGEWDKIPDEQKKIQATCTACHTAHREKLPDGGYKIK